MTEEEKAAVEAKILGSPNLDSNSPSNFLHYLSQPKDKLYKCRRCKKEFYPPFWFFEGLCDDCFKLFDRDKMNGRFTGIMSENSTKWIEDHPFQPTME